MVVTPGAILVHDTADAFWSEATAANLSLERIAEIGDSTDAVGTLAATAIGAAAAAGDTVSVDFSASPGSLLSTAQMLVATNDAFIGVNSLALWTNGEPTRATIPLVAWDAGTVGNAAIAAGFDAGQPDPAMGALNVDNGTATVGGVVALHDQFTGVQGWLTITPLASAVTFRATVTNASNPAMVVTPGAFLVHDAAGAFWSEATAANLSLERIAEIGDSTKAVNALGAAPAVGDTVSVDFTASLGSFLSLAQMLVATNDTSIGADSLALWTDGQPTRVTLPLIAWDAGTEDNVAIGAGFDAGQPDPAMGALNVDNDTATVDGVVALHTQFTGVQGWLTIIPIESTISVGSGLTLIGWTNSATTSTALIAANPDIDVLWFWDGTVWQSGTAALPIGLRTEFAINPSDAMFIVTGAETEIAIPLA